MKGYVTRGYLRSQRRSAARAGDRDAAQAALLFAAVLAFCALLCAQALAWGWA